MAARLVLGAEDVVGDSLPWGGRQRRLICVAVIGRRIHALGPATGEHRVWRLAAWPTSLVLRADDGALLGLGRHICRWDWEGEPEPILEVESDPETGSTKGPWARTVPCGWASAIEHPRR